MPGKDQTSSEPAWPSDDHDTTGGQDDGHDRAPDVSPPDGSASNVARTDPPTVRVSVPESATPTGDAVATATPSHSAGSAATEPPERQAPPSSGPDERTVWPLEPAPPQGGRDRHPEQPPSTRERRERHPERRQAASPSHASTHTPAHSRPAHRTPPPQRPPARPSVAPSLGPTHRAAIPSAVPPQADVSAPPREPVPAGGPVSAPPPAGPIAPTPGDPAAPEIADTAAREKAVVAPAPATPTQPPTEPPADQVPAQPRPRRRRRALVLAVVAVLLLAGGGVLAVPDVSNRLALPWAPNAPKADPPGPLTFSPSLHGPAGSAPMPTPSGVARVLDGPASAPALGTLTGSVVDAASGAVLWERQADRELTPASTTKLLTAAAALLRLDHGTRLTTTVVQGDEPGTVILVAGGDVTLSSLPEGKESIYPGAAHLDTLVEQVRQATDGDVKTVKLDLSAFAGDTTAPGWASGDAPSTFMAPVQPAMLDGGRSVATDEKSRRVGDPAGTLAREFAQRLGAEVGTPLTASAPANAQVLGEVESAPLPQLVEQMLRESDNLLAEVLARQVAIAEQAEPSFAGGAQAMLGVLARHGFDVGDVTLSDGSGLSTRNKVSAGLLAQLLTVAAAPEGDDPRTATLRPMLVGLPVAGGSGTLAHRYTDGPATDGKGWVRAKTGTLDGVNTLAGVVLDADGRVLVFALMSAGGDIVPARAALDEVAAQLRGCGCR